MNENPYDPENAQESILTREGIVTLSQFQTKTFDWGTKNFWRIEYKQDDREKTQFTEVSTGKKAGPGPDGEYLVDPKTGKETNPVASTAFTKSMADLKANGFDLKTLYPKISILVGYRVIFKGVPRVDRDGLQKTHVYNGETYKDYDFVPYEVVGKAGEWVSAPTGEAAVIAEKAIVELLNEQSPIKKVELIEKLNEKLAGNPLVNEAVLFALDDNFHDNKPWGFDGTKLEKIPF